MTKKTTWILVAAGAACLAGCCLLGSVGTLALLAWRSKSPDRGSAEAAVSRPGPADGKQAEKDDPEPDSARIRRFFQRKKTPACRIVDVARGGKNAQGEWAFTVAYTAPSVDALTGGDGPRIQLQDDIYVKDDQVTRWRDGYYGRDQPGEFLGD